MASIFRVARFAVRAELPAVPCFSRRLHVSARRFASEDPFAQDPRIVELRNKIQAHEGAKQAIMRLGQLMQDKGVDLSKPPSTMQVMKLGMDPDIREAGQNLMVQLKEAGVDINPETASQIFQNVVKDEVEPKDK
ncbi:uncharacterized protein CcaverHIS019_0212180 [Cutaneotrichosporon cavernicola]|uniref:Uncharacterized protein n=1 Tax=Cutaneotrichosporon cavernicola TaxID=279322 RepID=A0AA48L0G4_9TREE|nr:uncharacterized protein CcaverHIS019_0212180 [Cutaneotrichosporon cavernicola]BEI89856.1 hypothetical protein CcaverHIS019_0212180 [Cutaneotrichosporon cavernicola]BEI97626.1 hypothetical protein CcaverHIS631_0212150 [Cutaneotrichosporon cavernicola]BEJ05405.1 hypothetical protein CcaverHIS641_0212220 [Cutaneotrichosporon cavernicola]BEJ12753.1 hypothetical protein CspHIS471_0212130 [Cutaneotrichosporon sp. HIS471]